MEERPIDPSDRCELPDVVEAIVMRAILYYTFVGARASSGDPVRLRSRGCVTSDRCRYELKRSLMPVSLKRGGPWFPSPYASENDLGLGRMQAAANIARVMRQLTVFL
jgi:hypothetical protein